MRAPDKGWSCAFDDPIPLPRGAPAFYTTAIIGEAAAVRDSRGVARSNPAVAAVDSRQQLSRIRHQLKHARTRMLRC